MMILIVIIIIPPASGDRWYRGCFWSLSNIVSTLFPLSLPVVPKLWCRWSVEPLVAVPWPFCLHLLFDTRVGLRLCWILVPIWPHLAAQLRTKIQPKSLQEPSKMHPKSHLVFDHFLDGFLVDFFVDFRHPHPPKINQK